MNMRSKLWGAKAIDYFSSCRNSLLALSFVRMHPSIQLLDATLPIFSTPRMAIQRWEDSMTTPTP